MSRTKKNRGYWNSTSDAYQTEHGATLAEKALAWGVWRIPESELRVLGPVEGLTVLELGCGAAQWTVALVRSGARAVGIDISDQQLSHARALARRADAATRLVQGDAEHLPFQTQSFDVVFCDHGAMTFARPERTVAEVSRTLKPGGLFAFCMSSPIRDVCWDAETDRVSARLRANYFDLSALEDDECVCYQLPYGAWIRLFRQHSLLVEDLVELRAPEHPRTTYSDHVPAEWARRWPAEHVWKLRKTGPGRGPDRAHGAG